MQMQVQVTRKLQFHRPSTSTTADVNEIDQMYVVGISNSLGVEAWNSYSTAYSHGIQLVVWPDVSVLLTNRDTGKWLNAPPLLSRYRLMTSVNTNITAKAWVGYDNTESFPSYDFQVPLVTNLVFLTNKVYRQAGDQFVDFTGTFERSGGTNFYLPQQLEITFKPRLRFAMVDKDTQRIVDYVNLADTTVTNIMNFVTGGGNCGDPYTQDGGNGSMWCTNRMYGRPSSDATIATYGINNQILAGLESITADWTSSVAEYPAGMSKEKAVDFFRAQLGMSPLHGYTYQTSNTFNAPYQPFRNAYLVTSWQANDPLVHYTVGDLVDVVHTNLMLDQLNPAPTAVGSLNARYEPWGGGPARSARKTAVDLKVKDPLMLNSDSWDFPANKFPNAGWLGRVHRGTPWQTVYLKPASTDLTTWRQWTGNGLQVTNFGQMAYYSNNVVFSDAYLTEPTNDWHLLDLFTAALNDNATRGQLSINQTNLAAWSAVLSGVVTLTNVPDDAGDAVLNPQIINPAGIYNALDPTTWPPLVRLVKRINDVRSTNNASHTFTRLSDLLAVPELTVGSPFLNTNALPPFPSLANNGLNDAAYERLPQQIMGLLKVDSAPRFVIYAFGQTLKPESTRAIVKSGPFAGLCTNYQIMAESATRTVVRFEGAQPSVGGVPPPITELHPVIESFNVLPPD
jgi:hypothetical protein